MARLFKPKEFLEGQVFEHVSVVALPHRLTVGEGRLLHKTDNLHLLDQHGAYVAKDDAEQNHEENGVAFARGLNLLGDLAVFKFEVSWVLGPLKTEIVASKTEIALGEHSVDGHVPFESDPHEVWLAQLT